MLKARCKSPVSFIINHRAGGETERDGRREGWCVWGCFKPAVMSEPKQAGGGERRRGEGHVTLSGGIRSPSLSWNPYKESEAWCSNRRIRAHTHTHVTAITLLSVVNKRVRCMDYRRTIQVRTQPSACYSASCTVFWRPTLAGCTTDQNMSITESQTWFEAASRSAGISKRLSRNQWPEMANQSRVNGFDIPQ